MNALFLKDLAEKTRRGLEGRVREGRSGGGLCFGYDVVREHDARGEPIHGGRKVNEAEAATVRRIFAEFAAGKSPRRIAAELNRDRIAGPRGGEWDASTINGNAARGTGILNNELYIGRLVWNRLRYVKDPATGKRISRLNDPDRLVAQDVPELRIIPQDRWDAVKERQRLLKRDTRPDLHDKGAPEAALPDHRAGQVRRMRVQLRQNQRQSVRLCRRAQPRYLQQPPQHPPRHAGTDDTRWLAASLNASGPVQDLL